MSAKKVEGIQKSAAKPAFTKIYLEEVTKPELPGVTLEENVYAEMRDGVKLALDIYKPEKGGRYPVILSMSPYLKEIQQDHPGLCHSIESGATAFYVRRGYIHVICEMRGSGMSQGKWEFLGIKEQQDGYDVIEWIAKQPWCDGNVGMIGDSYWAWTQYLIAAQQPPHLKCIVPHDGGTDMYRGTFYKGGIFNKGGFADVWINDIMFQCSWPGPVEGKLPPTNLAADLAMHPEDGPWYWERSPNTKLDKIKVPVLFFVARTGLHSQSQLTSFTNFKGVKKLIVEPEGGAMAHMRFLTNRAVNEQILRWLDYWLKGKDTGIMDEPMVAIFDPIAKEWRYENEYPLKRTKWTKFYFHTDKPAPDVNEPQTQYGSLDTLPPQKDEYPNKYAMPIASELMLRDELVVVYKSEPLTQDTRICGPVSVTFYGSSTAKDTPWFLKVKDISPDNKIKLITMGLLRASFREVDVSKSNPGQPFHPFQNPQPLEPNKIYEFQVEMRPAFHTFKAGHRIMVDLQSDESYLSNLHSLDTRRFPYPAENTIYHDPEHPSHVLLPVIPDAPLIKPVGPPVSEIYWDLWPVHKWTRLPSDWRLL